MFGPRVRVHLRLLEVERALPALAGVVMELRDAALPLLASVAATAHPDDAFAGAHAAILVGSFPRGPSMQRSDLLKKNAPIFAAQGAALARAARPDVRVVVVGNPANTNAFILSRAAPSIPPENITALTRLDHNRLLSRVAGDLAVPLHAVAGTCIWGNHSSTQYPDVTRATVVDPDHHHHDRDSDHQHTQNQHHRHFIHEDAPSRSSEDLHSSTAAAATATATATTATTTTTNSDETPAKATTGQPDSVVERLGGLDYVRDTLIPAIQGRGVEIIRARGASSALSAASAIVDHMHSWFCGDHRVVSMAVATNGKYYGVPDGLFFSFPVKCTGLGHYAVVDNLPLDKFSQEYIDKTVKELLDERAEAEACLAD